MSEVLRNNDLLQKPLDSDRLLLTRLHPNGQPIEVEVAIFDCGEGYVTVRYPGQIPRSIPLKRAD